MGKVIFISAVCLYIVINAIIAKKFTVKEMYTRFIKGQCVVGKITANCFYSLAWVLKGIKFLAVNLIK